MQSANQNLGSEGKQFRLVKFFAWASFIVILIFSFPFSMVISQQAKEILLRSYENNAILVGENLNHQVFQNFVIPVNWRYGGIRLRDKEQSELMDKIVQSAIHGFNVDLVNVYDIGKGVIAYSTDPDLIGKKVRESLGYKRAIQGERSSGLISTRDEFWGLGIDFMGGKKTLRTYIPFRVENPYTGLIGIGGVFELIQDMGKQYESIVKFQYLIFGLSILIMGLIFLALLLIVHKAERMIEQRAQERRELESQLHLAERLAALGQMVAGISHEVKNPLGIIRSTAELLGEMPDASDTQKRLSGVIKEESTRLNQIVTEFLDFARPQVPNIQECQLEEIIEKNLSFIRPELEKKGIQVQDNLNGRSFKLRADHDLLYRAFLNILINAIHSMQDGGTIDIKVEEARDAYRIDIEDTGCGISEENVDKIFNPFFTTKEKGSGLGLSIVRKIIEGHRGTIGIKSIEGQGTKVQVQLPRRG
ncbi:MAG: GHKL domain-containing protein [Deltaproteobacteria bacterium]|nr:MAG: GHKL domain-containing protein [Deltaproteobacteria bacterium]